MHEAACHEQNCFVTLTYDDDHLPNDGSLDREAFPLFLKRLRKAIEPARVRYFHSGEYGERSGRPHYHALLFGFDPPDKRRVERRAEHAYWTSVFLEERWGNGRCLLGSVSFESAAYVARYVMKKVTGERAAEHYQGREPEYATMSRRPGIGRGWFDQFGNEVYRPDGPSGPRDSVIARGFEQRPPRYYDEQLGEADPAELFFVKRARAQKLRLQDQTPERLVVRESVAKARASLYQRRSL